jgi:hypothetical protein
MKLKERFTLAGCCRPAVGEPITGYCSHNGPVRVHRSGCAQLATAEAGRLVTLAWDDIIAGEDFRPGDDYGALDDIDFRILDHHDHYGVDYSRPVAATLNLDTGDVFSRHARLRSLALLIRVEPTMIQYRKNIVPGKWIKHRNHTYYDLTPKGKAYLAFHRSGK